MCVSAVLVYMVPTKCVCPESTTFGWVGRMWENMGRCEEVWGGVRWCVEVWGGVWRCGEVWVVWGGCGEVWDGYGKIMYQWTRGITIANWEVHG